MALSAASLETDDRLSDRLADDIFHPGPKKRRPFGNAELTSASQTRDGTQREPCVLLERRKLLRVYHHLREKREEEGVADILETFKNRARQAQEDLDTLNTQCRNVRLERVHTEKTGEHLIPVTEFDLHPSENGEDSRTPYVLIGGFTTTPRRMASTAMAFAMRGERVIVLGHTETVAAHHPKDWRKRLKEHSGLDLHTLLFQELITQLGLEDLHLVGYSMGGAISLQLAADPAFQGRINDLIILEPVALEQKGTPKMTWDFIIRQALLRTVTDPEAFLRAWSQGAEPAIFTQARLLLRVGRILSKQQVTEETLRRVHPRGNYTVFFGDDSPMAGPNAMRAFHNAESGRQGKSPVRIALVDGWSHDGPLVDAHGMVKVLERMNGTPQRVHNVRIRVHSLAESILRDI